MWFPLCGEAILTQARCGDLLALMRVDQKLCPPLPGAEIPDTESDQYERMVVGRSRDGGRFWTIEEWGSYYGEMYPAMIRLADGRLLLTFTVRAAVPARPQPLGIQAVLGEEKPDGFVFDFENDRFVLDEKTPAEQWSGGGFGPTVQLEDGTLVSSYSYRTADGKTHLEVVRWRLPNDR